MVNYINLCSMSQSIRKLRFVPVHTLIFLRLELFSLHHCKHSAQLCRIRACSTLADWTNSSISTRSYSCSQGKRRWFQGHGKRHPRKSRAKFTTLAMETHFDVFALGQERRGFPEAVAKHVVDQDAVQSHSAPAGKVV